jgi:hypothetical protein
MGFLLFQVSSEIYGFYKGMAARCQEKNSLPEDCCWLLVSGYSFSVSGEGSLGKNLNGH